jgi:murein L,D-transpeptidase YafK
MRAPAITLIISISIILLYSSFSTITFKEEQQQYPHVKQAYKDKEKVIAALLRTNAIDNKNLRIYLRVFKTEKKLELWAKNHADKSYKLIREYDICQTSGVVGPKRMEGDLQIPEGFYHINRFNPLSNFYLSLGINYPNPSDRILGVKGKPGGAIFIHGSCVTIGCMPVTDDKIKELYVFCVEAKAQGQVEIPVTIYPAKFSHTAYTALTKAYETDSDKLGLWADLKQGYDYFEKNSDLPLVRFLANGKHRISNP